MRTYSESRVVARATADEHETSTAFNVHQIVLDATEIDGEVVEVDTTTHRVEDGLGLFEDLLLHEVVVAAYKGGLEQRFE